MRRAIVRISLAIALAFPLAALTAQVVAGEQQTRRAQIGGTVSTSKPAPDPLAAKLVDAARLIEAHQPREALPILDAVIASERSRYAGEKRTIYSARSLTETLMYLTLSAEQKKPAIVLDATWSLALFMKGFALIDAERRGEGGDYLKQAVAMAPMNSQYLGESAEFQKHDKDFTGALATFQKAADAAPFAPENVKGAELRRAWRGMAYVYVEQGKLDEAEALYRKCLAANPDDKGAAAELEYVAKQRLKTTPM